MIVQAVGLDKVVCSNKNGSGNLCGTVLGSFVGAVLAISLERFWQASSELFRQISLNQQVSETVNSYLKIVITHNNVLHALLAYENTTWCQLLISSLNHNFWHMLIIACSKVFNKFPSTLICFEL